MTWIGFLLDLSSSDFSPTAKGSSGHGERIRPESVTDEIAQAGVAGMTRTQIGHAVSLEPDVLNHLLDGLVAGMLMRAGEAGNLVFRTRQTPSAGSPAGIAVVNSNTVDRR